MKSPSAEWSLNCIETPIGCHLSVIGPNLFAYPYHFALLLLLDDEHGKTSHYDDKYPCGLPAGAYMGFINPALCLQHTIMGFRITHKAIGMLLRDLELSFICPILWQRELQINMIVTSF